MFWELVGKREEAVVAFIIVLPRISCGGNERQYIQYQ
jgi:hypothetical protein